MGGNGDGTKQGGMRDGLTSYGDPGFSLYLRKSFAKSMGYSDSDLDRPVIGIADTGSDYNNCHRTMPELVEAVKRGVMYAGGLPLAFPTVSLVQLIEPPPAVLLRIFRLREVGHVPW